MLKLIIGVKGTGKTKTLIEMVNQSAEESQGNVICIERGSKLKYDITYKVRLIDTNDYSISNSDSLYGLICGLYAANYDITHIFIDSALKICNNNMEQFKVFIDLADAFAKKNNLQFIITSSADPAELPAELKVFMQ